MDANELSQRLACANRADTARGIFFNAVTTELQTELGDQATREVIARVGSRGWVEFFWYPATDFLQLLFEAARVMGPKVGGPDSALRRFGRAATRSFFSSPVGKTLRLFVMDGKPESLLSSAPAAYAIGVNYGKRSFEQLGAGRGKLSVQGDPVPWRFHEGVICAALEEVHCTSRVEAMPHSVNVVDYTISWTRRGQA